MFPPHLPLTLGHGQVHLCLNNFPADLLAYEAPQLVLHLRKVAGVLEEAEEDRLGSRILPQECGWRWRQRLPSADANIDGGSLARTMAEPKAPECGGR